MNWTIVRPVTLTSAEKTGSIRLTDRYGLSHTISRSSVASFFLDCTESSKFMQELPTIQNTGALCQMPGSLAFPE
ncbi:NAD(P)H-binding protein [Ruegeria arenilitoris]|uniref:NAD(P)H-binding protein n=1 Tax=Ruegeria arenilitoris TaxID=1173585 RepID=UPI00346466D4